MCGAISGVMLFGMEKADVVLWDRLKRKNPRSKPTAMQEKETGATGRAPSSPLSAPRLREAPRAPPASDLGTTVADTRDKN